MKQYWVPMYMRVEDVDNVVDAREEAREMAKMLSSGGDMNFYVDSTREVWIEESEDEEDEEQDEEETT